MSGVSLWGVGSLCLGSRWLRAPLGWLPALIIGWLSVYQVAMSYSGGYALCMWGKIEVE